MSDICNSSMEFSSNSRLIMKIITVLYKFFQLRHLQLETQPQNEENTDVNDIWKHPYISPGTLNHWKLVLFWIPITEFILILTLFLLVMISYNIHPIGCLSVEVNYNIYYIN